MPRKSLNSSGNTFEKRKFTEDDFVVEQVDANNNPSRPVT